MENSKSLSINTELQISTAPDPGPREFMSADEAVEALQDLYHQATGFLRSAFTEAISGKTPDVRHRAFYPRVSITTTSHAQMDSRLAFGYVHAPGTYGATITRPDLFAKYLRTQIKLLLSNHDGPVVVEYSTTPIPLHFALHDNMRVEGSFKDNLKHPLRDLFDVPDLASTDDRYVNGQYEASGKADNPLAPFTAQRVDYSLHRLSHYTATGPEHFQNYVLFTNYQFYVDEFIEFAKRSLEEPNNGYDSFIEPGNRVSLPGKPCLDPPLARYPQMPAYHLTRGDNCGITLINIGVGPSNAKTITDHVAVLRPHTWLMLGHCAGLRNSQRLGDYVLAHAYVREDHVLDDDLPVWVPVPALAEVQVALERAVAGITGYSGYELKRVMRTGTVATIDNRNWELRDQTGPVHRLSQSRAIALDMESATIAANGFRFRVPYGTLLCVSDKPLHGELKLPGMATEFYDTQVRQHLAIGIKALESLREMPMEQLHSRKLRSFFETAFQ